MAKVQESITIGEKTMIDMTTLTLFIGVAIVILVTPGPAVIYIVTRSIDQGSQAGIVSALGIALGTFVHVLAAALGLSATLVSSVLAFNVVKYIGAAYLIYLGVRQFLTKEDIQQSQLQENRNLKDIFYQAVIVNILNPKIALFIFAFLPQFVKVSNGPVGIQMLILGLTLVILGICSDSLYVLLARSVSGLVKRNYSMLSKQRFFTGSVYITLGLATALSSNRK